jgi:cytochrome c oxidase assembly protein subunit 15
MSQYRPHWLSFRRFAAFTTGLVLSLMMLGVYTAATGSGLACSAQWPLCDNGLLPQTIPSFIEWFHRLVAMVAGFFILGTALWSFSAGDRRTKTTATLALRAVDTGRPSGRRAHHLHDVGADDAPCVP